MARQSWVDPETNEPLIDDHARNLDSFLATFADGKVDADELEKQEQRLVALMKDIEPGLDDEMHAKITQLLCELTAYDIMQFTHELHQARPATQFRG